MRKAQLFSEDIIFAFIVVLFTFSLWLILRDRVVTIISASENKRQIDEAASTALGQLLESSGTPTNWNTISAINETTVGSIGLASDRNVLDYRKVETFVNLSNSGGSNYTSVETLLGLYRAGYLFNFTVSYLNGTAIYTMNYTPSTGLGSADFSAINTTAVIERYALLNNTMVKVTLGVWID